MSTAMKQQTLFADYDQTFSVAETHALSTVEREAMERVGTPTCPVECSAWSDDAIHGGWSARMFLHQLLTTLRPHWSTSDTEQLLSESTPLRLRANPGKGISLSDVIKPLGNTCEACSVSAKAGRGLTRRILARDRSFRLLLRTECDTTPAIVTFGNPADSASWTVKSAKPLPDSQRTGLLDYLRQHAPECTETASSQPAPNGSADAS